MSKESTSIIIKAEAPWDGSTEAALNRNNAEQTPGGRIWTFALAGPVGVINPDFGGLFSPSTPKMVGVALEDWSPENKARVGVGPFFRQEFTLKPTVQYVLLQPGDKLSIRTVTPRATVMLLVNELNEGETVLWGGAHEPFEMPSRMRIVRQTGVAFAPSPTNTWQPTFTYDPTTNLLIATDDGTGALPAQDLCLYPRFQGCYISVRYAGSAGDGKLHIVDGMTRKTWIAQTAIDDVRWSQVQYVSHDDSIALEASPAVVGELMVADIEISRVFPGNRLAARYQSDL
ncbi:MAG: hypothetical protein R3B09_01740 [Nannocystaceae bacterium]